MNKEEIRKNLLLRRSILEDMRVELSKDEKFYIDKFCKHKVGDMLPEPFSNEILEIKIDYEGEFCYIIEWDEHLIYNDVVEEWKLHTLFKYGDIFVDNLGTELFITSMWFNDVSNEVEYELCEEFYISETELKNNYKHVNKRIS